MNRTEYMSRLAELLQDVPVEERVAAMQYYNDYFDDAGKENEEKVIEELGSPEKVAAEMKAGLGRRGGDAGEFRETGYTDTQFEDRSVPEKRTPVKEQPWTNKWLKIGLIVVIILIAAPFLVPVAIGIIGVTLGLVAAAFLTFLALVIAAVAVTLSGVIIFVKGGFLIFVNMAAAMMLMGSGLIITAIGMIATVASVRICIIVLPGLFRFFVELCRRPFHKRKAVA